MLLSEKYAAADINAMKSYERNEGGELLGNKLPSIRDQRNSGRISLLGILSAVSMCIPDFGRSRDGMSDKETDGFIRSVRAERNSMANLQGPIGRSIVETILNTPKPDRTKLREDADRCLAAILREKDRQ